MDEELQFTKENNNNDINLDNNENSDKSNYIYY
jgi:hypothetical protein